MKKLAMHKEKVFLTFIKKKFDEYCINMQWSRTFFIDIFIK